MPNVKGKTQQKESLSVSIDMQLDHVKFCLCRPVNRRLLEEHIIQHNSSDKLIADAIVETAVQLWTTAVFV